ncbi:MAG TPA: formyl transferase [Burkholderiaceae bacterium]|nr:formyl transferase [Burkholderiaceae bacterium]
MMPPDRKPDGPKVVLLCIDSLSSRVVANALHEAGLLSTLVIEKKISSRLLLRNRIRRLGLPAVLGQLLFKLWTLPLQRRSGQRIQEILRERGLKHAAFPHVDTHHVPSVNAPECLSILAELRPAVCVINGTRIVSSRTLDSIDAPFVNTHCGITPNYRGVHGGYWAVRNQDIDNFGSTIHFVDSGIDTGQVIEQVFVKPEPGDGFYTYPVLQTSAAMPALCRIVRTLAHGGEVTTLDRRGQASRLFHHPTLAQYLSGRKVP